MMDLIPPWIDHLAHYGLVLFGLGVLANIALWVLGLGVTILCALAVVLIGGLGIEFGLPLLAMALGAGGLFGIALPLYDSYVQQFLHATDPHDRLAAWNALHGWLELAVGFSMIVMGVGGIMFMWASAGRLRRWVTGRAVTPQN
jgi:hypothetical protein